MNNTAEKEKMPNNVNIFIKTFDQKKQGDQDNKSHYDKPYDNKSRYEKPYDNKSRNDKPYEKKYDLSSAISDSTNKATISNFQQIYNSIDSMNNHLMINRYRVLLQRILPNLKQSECSGNYMGSFFHI